jgi:hypothetical protein
MAMTACPNVLPSTASGIETVWSASTAIGATVAAIGAGITATNLRAAQRAHRRTLNAARPDRLHISITEQAVRNEVFTVAALVLVVLVLGLFVTVGVVAMFTPEPIRPEVSTADFLEALALVAGAILLTIVAVVLTVESALNRRDRHAITSRITGRLLTEEMQRRLATRRHQDGESGPEQSP